MVYTYSSPNTMWINVVHKYNSWLLYYEMLCHHWETSAQDPNDHAKKKKNVKRTKSLPEKKKKKSNKLIHVPI